MGSNESKQKIPLSLFFTGKWYLIKFLDHGSRSLACEGALLRLVAVLGGHADSGRELGSKRVLILYIFYTYGVLLYLNLFIIWSHGKVSLRNVYSL